MSVLMVKKMSSVVAYEGSIPRGHLGWQPSGDAWLVGFVCTPRKDRMI